ncbi:MAG TPA: EF-P beta-lysylation protein EpmB [Oceanospirillales bacterium]|nr:EF-P beta-lysylation protein EpmB [Oceanospirillales bacterium]
MDKPQWRHHSRNHAGACDFIGISKYDSSSEDLFRLHIPHQFKRKIDFNNPNDPLLLQVIPTRYEHREDQSYSDDPVGDQQANKGKGIIHKYHGRVLLITTGSCAINCRYCFRRSYPYAVNNASANNWTQALSYIKANDDIHEVILSGGDPLMLATKTLEKFSTQLQHIKHVKTLRIHTRMPIVTPTRITDNFLNWLHNLPFKKVMVLHSNHANELSSDLTNTFKSISATNTQLLNQSVLLKKINDNSQTLAQLSHRLFDFGILPYYLNQLDKVTGTQHFCVSNQQAKAIHKELLKILPGYLVPKLVVEISGKEHKSPLF